MRGSKYRQKPEFLQQTLGFDLQFIWKNLEVLDWVL